MARIRDILRSLSTATLAASTACVLPQTSSLQTQKPQCTSNSASDCSNSILIRLEQRKGNAVFGTRPDHVFESGDVVRFRLTSGFDGYLYVLERGSSGSYTALFPAGATTSDNVIYKGKQSLVPPLGDGWFQIDGPPGFDVVYFLVSPTPIDLAADNENKPNTAPPDTPESNPSVLKPRCNDAVFRARGECVDDSAGLSSLGRDVPLPPQITTVLNISRDIVFEANDDDKSVKATALSTSPVVYIFRLAHH